MCTELKIKSKHLALEPAIIRAEEFKLMIQNAWARKKGNEKLARATDSQRENLYLHRKKDVGREARATFLARAYLKGQPYRQVEKHREPELELEFQGYIINRITSMVNKYKVRGTPDVSRGDIIKWAE